MRSSRVCGGVLAEFLDETYSRAADEAVLNNVHKRVFTFLSVFPNLHQPYTIHLSFLSVSAVRPSYDFC